MQMQTGEKQRDLPRCLLALFLFWVSRIVLLFSLHPSFGGLGRWGAWISPVICVGGLVGLVDRPAWRWRILDICHDGLLRPGLPLLGSSVIFVRMYSLWLIGPKKKNLYGFLSGSDRLFFVCVRVCLIREI